MENIEKDKVNIILPKNYYGDTCWQCEELLKQGKEQKEIIEQHDNCHGWYHCGGECCGCCSVCGN